MFRVEIKNNGVWTPFYSTNDPSLEYGLVGVSLNKSLNEADSFAFTILPTHPLYNSLVKLTTLIRVYWDSVLFFDGRVASWTTDMYGQRQVSCESAISYLIDSVARSETKSGSSGSKTHKQTVREAIEYIIGLHNAEMTGADAYKQFQIGEISSRHADREIQYDVSSFQDVKKLLYATVKDKFGGYFRARLGHNQNGSEVNLIDYIDDFGVVNDRPAAVFTENIVEMSRDQNSDGLFTVMIPVGQKTGSSSGHVYITDAVPDGTIYYDPKDPEHRFPLKKVGDELINEAYAAKYGHVVRAQTFSDVPSNETGKTNLYERACQYMYKKISELEDTKFEVTMVDMHYLDPDIPMIDLGDKLRLVSSHHGIDKYVYCLSCKIDVLDPEQSSYSFGPMPDEEDPSKSTQSSRSSSGSGEDGIADNNLIKTYDQVAITAKESFAAISKGDFEILGHGTVNITALKEEADNLNGAIITLNDEVKVYGEDIDALKDDKQLVSRITANADEIVLNTSRLYFQDNYSQKKSVSDFKDNNMLYDRTQYPETNQTHPYHIEYKRIEYYSEPIAKDPNKPLNMEDLNNDPNFSGKYRWSKRVRVYGVPSHNLVIIARYHGKVTALDGMSLWTLDDANWSGYRNELDDFVTDEERYIESTTKIVDLVDYLEVDPNGKLTFFIQGEHTTTKIDPETGLPIVEYHAGGIDFTSIVDGINQPGVTNINGDKITFKNGTPIIEAINTIDPDAETTLKIKASVIDLDGYVTTQTLAAGFTSSGRIEAKELSSKNLYVDEQVSLGETSITTLSANSATVRDPLSDDKLDVATKLKYVTSFGAARYDQTVGGTTFDVSIPYVLGNGQNESGTINFNIASTAKYKQAEALQYVSSSLGTATGWKKEVGPPGSGVTNYYIDIPVTITKNGGSTPETHRALFNKVYNEIFALGQQGSSSQYEAGYIAGWAKAASLMQMNLDANMTRGCKVKMFGPPSSISSSQEGETASAQAIKTYTFGYHYNPGANYPGDTHCTISYNNQQPTSSSHTYNHYVYTSNTYATIYAIDMDVATSDEAHPVIVPDGHTCQAAITATIRPVSMNIQH